MWSGLAVARIGDGLTQALAKAALALEDMVRADVEFSRPAVSLPRRGRGWHEEPMTALALPMGCLQVIGDSAGELAEVLARELGEAPERVRRDVLAEIADVIQTACQQGLGGDGWPVGDAEPGPGVQLECCFRIPDRAVAGRVRLTLSGALMH